jgi:hypothetical protein
VTEGRHGDEGPGGGGVRGAQSSYPSSDSCQPGDSSLLQVSDINPVFLLKDKYTCVIFLTSVFCHIVSSKNLNYCS